MTSASHARRNLRGQPRVAQQGVEAGPATTEVDEKIHGLARATLREDRVAKAAPGLLREMALLECSKRVCGQHLRPLVAVVAGRVAPREDVREAVGHSTPGRR